MPVFIVAFVIGICALQQMPDLPAMSTLLSLAIAGCCLLAMLVGGHGKSALAGWNPPHGGRRWLRLAGRGVAVAGGLMLGFAWGGINAQFRMEESLPVAWEGRDIAVTGVVASLPEPGERSVRFDLDVEQSEGPVPPHIRLSWYPKEEHGKNGESNSPVRAGERWRMVVRLKRPHGQVNPYGFDYEAYLLERDIRATGYVRPDSAERIDAEVSGWRYVIVRARQDIRDHFFKALPVADGVPSYAGVLVALAVGDQSSIPAAQWQTFARTGITHLMSISGLHVTMLAALAYSLSALIWRTLARRGGRVGVWLLHWPLPQVCSLVGFCVAAAYCALAGFGLPAQRTLYMIATVALAQWSRRNIGFVPGLTLALWVVVILDPWAVLSAGFWLSFMAVAILLWTAKTVSVEPANGAAKLGGRTLQIVLEWGRAQWAVTLMTLPVLLALFGQFSLISPLTNAFAIPLVSFVVTPLALIAAVTGTESMLRPSHEVMVVMMHWLEAMAAWPLAVWQQAAAPWWWVALALAGAIWILFPKPLPWRWVGGFLFVPLLAWQPDRPMPGDAWVRVLDVGQGLAVHIQTHKHDALFDTGPGYSAEADAGNRLLIPYFRALGVQRLDTLIVSHGDSDHAGGAVSVARGLPVGQMMHSLPADSDLLATLTSLASVGRCQSGQGWEWDKVHLTVLHPDNLTAKGRRNSVACVLRVEAAGHAILLPSDIEAPQESALVRRREQGEVTLRADVLVAPHHGSRTSSTQTFIDAVAPSSVIFPVGYRNSYGHPADDVIARYMNRDTNLLRTDRDGAVLIRLSPQGIEIDRERQLQRRYWHGG